MNEINQKLNEYRCKSTCKILKIKKPPKITENNYLDMIDDVILYVKYEHAPEMIRLIFSTFSNVIPSVEDIRRVQRLSNKDKWKYLIETMIK